MVIVPSGKFAMGAPDPLDAKPQHGVTLSRSFAVGVNEVTFEEYDQFVRDTGIEPPNDNGWGRGKRPVIDVSWDDAQAYARWLTARTAKRYRLLTEAEWEYVARAGTSTVYWWGDDKGSGNANCNGCGSRWDNTQSAPVGSFSHNPFGLFDTAGNVFEWVEDCYHASYVGAPSDGSAWTGDGCERRVLRGGSWFNVPALSRSAYRGGYAPSAQGANFGFRLARDI